MMGGLDCARITFVGVQKSDKSCESPLVFVPGVSRWRDILRLMASLAYVVAIISRSASGQGQEEKFGE